MTTAVATCCEFHGPDCSNFGELCCDRCPKVGPDEMYGTGPEEQDEAGDDDLDQDAEEAEPKNLYRNVHEFMPFLAAVYAHEVSTGDQHWRWCPQWFCHTEAVARIEACWKAFEVLRRDPGTGASVWFRDHADPCMTNLTKPDGPFSRCNETKHKAFPPLPLADPPAWLLRTQEIS